MNKLYSFVTMIADNLRRLPIILGRLYIALALDIKYDMEHNIPPYATDKEYLAYVKTQLSGRDQMCALRTFKRNYRTWLRKQKSK